MQVETYLATAVIVTVPDGTNIGTPAGYLLMKQLAAFQFAALLASGNFDIAYSSVPGSPGNPTCNGNPC